MTTRSEYIEKAKARLDRWDAKLDVAEAKVREANADTKLAYQEELVKMRHKRDEARETLTSLQNASESAWDDMRQGAEKAWGQLEDAFESAYGRFG
jgi:hypothetical protein